MLDSTLDSSLRGSPRSIALVLLVGAVLSVPSAAAVIHVDDGAAGTNDGSSWANAYVHLADALALAQAGDEVWVATGLYRPDQGIGKTLGDRDAFLVVPSGVGLYGGFAGTEATLAARAGLFSQTILSGDLLGDDQPGFVNRNDNSRNVMRLFGAAATTVVDGFRIRGGNGALLPAISSGGGISLGSASPTLRSIEFVDNESNTGGALSASNGFPVIESCSFVGNRATNQGGAVHVYEILGDVTFRDTVFIENESRTSVGGGIHSGRRVTLTDCRFERNVAAIHGGGVYISGGKDLDTPVPGFDRLTRCLFLDNEALAVNGNGGGVATFGDARLVSCRFAGNRAGIGGALHVRPTLFGPPPSPTLVGCTFSGNHATTAGGAVAADPANVRLLGSTVADNVSAGIGGGLALLGSATVTVANSIVWGNQDPGGGSESAQLFADGAGAFVVDHSCVESWSGLLGGVGNHGLNPSFTDADGADNQLGTEDDDHRLSPGSPCIDAGANGQVAADKTDLDQDGVLIEDLPADLDGLARFADDPAVVDTGVGVSPPVVDMGAYEAPGVPRVCQTDLGFAGPGTVRLDICGQDLTVVGHSAAFDLRGAPAGAPLWIIVSPAANPTPVSGGVLVPDLGVAHFVLAALSVGSDGTLVFPVAAPGVPATVVVQAVAADGGAFQFSNALRVQT